MKKARFSESQIVAILKEADAGLPVGEVIRKHGISSASYYKWKAKYGGLDASELKRIKELEGQLAEFKQIVADLTLENKAMKGLITNRFFRQPESVKQSSIWRADEKLPVTRACGCVGLSRAAYYRKPMDQAKRDAPVVDVLNQIVANKHGRWGFGLCFSWMRNNGYLWNHKRVWRGYKDMRLNLPRRTKRRLPKLPKQPLTAPTQKNINWALDFMHDTLYYGKP